MYLVGLLSRHLHLNLAARLHDFDVVRALGEPETNSSFDLSQQVHSGPSPYCHSRCKVRYHHVLSHDVLGVADAAGGSIWEGECG